MAIFHLNMSILQRSKGQSGVAGAAYRSGSRLVDERTGLVHDYRKKKDIIYSTILAPDDSPPWVFNRQTLWTSAGAAGRRADSQEARQITLALPHELKFADQVALLCRFGRHLNSLGMVVDANLHSGGRSKRNVHGHLMTPMRGLTPDGFGKTNRGWNDRDLVSRLRIVWQEMVNEALAAGGSSERVSHSSLANQGIHRKPTRHIGARVSAMARSGNSWAMRLAKAKRGRIDEITQVRNHFRQYTITKLQHGWLEPVLAGATDCRPGAADSAFRIPSGVGESDPRSLAGRRR